MKRALALGSATLLTALLALGGSFWLQHERNHHLEPAAYGLETATEGLFNDLEAPTHRQQYAPHGAEDAVAALMATNALQVDARAFLRLIRKGGSETELRTAAQELDRQTRQAEPRIVHARATLEARRHFQQVRAAVEELLRELRLRAAGDAARLQA